MLDKPRFKSPLLPPSLSLCDAFMVGFLFELSFLISEMGLFIPFKVSLHKWGILYTCHSRDWPMVWTQFIFEETDTGTAVVIKKLSTLVKFIATLIIRSFFCPSVSHEAQRNYYLPKITWLIWGLSMELYIKFLGLQCIYSFSVYFA